MSATTQLNIGSKSVKTLPLLFQGEIEQIFLLEDHHDYCAQITLWYREGRGVSITSEMHDITDRLEVGVLRLQGVNQPPADTSIAFPKPDTPRSLALAFSIPPTQVWKLKVTAAEITCESGLRLSSQENEITIIASGRPCFLSVSMNNSPLTAGGPEYDISDYDRELIF